MDRAARAKEIIKRTPVVTLATVSAEGTPRSTPVTAAFDEQYNCYWTSFADTEHSKNIRSNSSIFISLFDAAASPIESADGVYIKARAVELSDLEEIDQAAACVYGRKGKEPRVAADFVPPSNKRIYKAVPEQSWVSLTEDFEVDPATSRKEITL